MKMGVVVNDKRMAEIERTLGDFHKKAPNAVSNALNRGASAMNTLARKEIRQVYHIKAGDISPTLSIFRASKSALFSKVESKGGVIPLDKFKVSPGTINPNRKTPIKVAVKKSAPKTLGGAFMAEVNGPKLFKRSGKTRLPIQRLFGPSVPQMLKNEKSKEIIEKHGEETFNKRLDHEINRILERGAGSK